MMKKKIIALLVIVLMLSPFLEGLLSASSIWKTSASNDETEEIIKNDNLVLTQTLQESQEGPYIQLDYQKRKAQEDENLRLHFLVKEDSKKNIEIDDADGFVKTEDGWYSEQRVSETGSLKIPVTAGTKYQLYTRFVSEIPVKESEDNPEGTTENVEKNVGEVIETPLLNDKEQEAKELIFVPAKQELDFTNLKNPNDTETLVQIKGFEVSYTSTLKDNGNKADWQLKFDKNLVEGLNYRIRYSVYDNQNPKNANENGAEPKFQEMNIKDNNNRERKYRQERYADDKTKTASLKNSFTTSFSTDGKAINLIIGLVDENDNFVALFNDNNVVAVDSGAKSNEASSNSRMRAIGSQDTDLIGSYDGTIYDALPWAAYAPLRAAGNFHIFANEVTLKAHTNGNFATRRMLGGSQNAGSGAAHEYFYVQEFKGSFSGINKAHSTNPGHFIVGKDVEVSKNQNNWWVFDNQAIGQMPSNPADFILRESTNTPFIDFDKEFAFLKNVNLDTAQQIPDGRITMANVNKENKINFDLSPYYEIEGKSTILIEIDPELMVSGKVNEFFITGLLTDEQAGDNAKSFVFNVPLTDKNNKDSSHNQIPITVKGKNNSSINPGETTNFKNSSILWNYYYRTGNESSGYAYATYIGKIKNGGNRWTGSILAPGASYEGGSGIDGSVIVDKYLGDGGETHRWDFSPYGEVTLIKEDGQGNFLEGAVFDLYERDATGNPEDNGKLIKTGLTTDYKGRLTVKGLSQGVTYRFVETRAPVSDTNGVEYQLDPTPLDFTLTSGLNVTVTYKRFYNYVKQKDFKFNAYKKISSQTNEKKTFMFEIQTDKGEETVAWGRADIPANSTENHNILFYTSKEARDKKNDNELIEQKDWQVILSDNTNYQLVETDKQGYSVQFTGANDGKFRTQFSNDDSAHVEIYATNYKNALSIQGKKTIDKEVAEENTFKFELREGLETGKVIAYGKAEVKENSKEAEIKFFRDSQYSLPIVTDGWYDVVDTDKDYFIVETEKSGYSSVKYQIDGKETNQIQFIPGGINEITFEVKNSKKEEEPKITLKGTKKLVDETLQEKETKTFHFELRHQAGEKPAIGDKLVANGEAVTSNGDPADIIFTETNNTAITTAEQWTNLLKPGKYYIVETDSDGYSVTYTISGIDSGPEKNSFTIPATLEKSITIQFEAVNTKDKSYKFEAQKKVTGNVPLPKEGKTFKFEIQDKSGVPVAFGSANILAKNKPVNIVFTDKDENSITDWTKILNDGEKYTLVETTTEYHVSYLDESGSNKENTFTVEYGDNATMYFLVQNDLDVGDLPSTGGSGIVKFMQLSLIVILIGVGIGGYYWYRNKKVN